MSHAAIRKPSRAFIWRRIHSLTGFWLVIFLLEHMTVNSQATLWIGDDGHGFVRLVNFLESLPFLQVVEVVLIGIPLLVHALWGIQRMREAKSNVVGSQKGPVLPYSRNIAYTLQRLSSIVLLVGIVLHVVQMRFLDYPKEVIRENKQEYLVKISFDEGLYTLGHRLGATFYSKAMVQEIRKAHERLWVGPEYFPEINDHQGDIQNQQQYQKWVQDLSSFDLKKDEVIAASYKPGTAMLLTVRDTFKSPWMAVFYTLFVLAAAFHAFNGLWTFLITWGWILSYRSQRAMLPVAWCGMALITFLGLMAIWGSYFLNLRF